MTNPFFYGTPVDRHGFLNRRNILRRIISRIVNQGQSTAIVGEPRMGKSSLLEYISAPQNVKILYGELAEKLVFSFIDIQMLGGQFTQNQFWEEALKPVFEKIILPDTESRLAQHYQICIQNHFGTFTLERFFKQMQEDGWRLVLLLDEFDLLLYHPVLNCAEFFGSLRALASRGRGALAIITASRQSLTVLNTKTQELNPTGSPYFNIFAELNLGPFPNRDIVELINRAGDSFSKEDRRFIDVVAGGHPYLLQAAASAMWEEKTSNDIYRNHIAVGKRLYQETKFHFSDTWRFWPPTTRKALTAIALIQIPYLLNSHQFLTTKFVKELPNFAPEINYLKMTGLVVEDKKLSNGYRIVQGALLWWLADELLRTVRDDSTFEEWLQSQEFIGLLTRNEINHLANAIKIVGELLQHGATTLIEASAKGLFV